jgi:hypothetical protein
VGIDCEWKPDTLVERLDPQPILLLQISLHQLRKVFLLDLQTLLRPLQSPSEPMNEVEEAVAAVIKDLLTCAHALKVGFQLVGDLRRLAASYPHIMMTAEDGAIGKVEGVVEVSRLSRKVMRVTKQRNARFVSSSLARMVEHYLKRSIDKRQQCSDWSARPLTSAQMEYAALDAAIGPVILEQHFLTAVANAPQLQIMTAPLQIGRWKDDVSFAECITSWEFVVASATGKDVVPTASIKQRGKNYRRLFGNLPPIITHRWITGTR